MNHLNWEKVLADYRERFDEIREILSVGETLTVSRVGKCYVLNLDGRDVADHLDETDLDSILHALWLLSETPHCLRNVVASFCH